MERQTDAAEMRFRVVAQSSSDAIVIGDQAGNVLFWNNGAQTIFGYQSEEMVGKSLSLLMPERYRTSHQRGMTRLSDTGEAHMIGKTVELHGLRKTGEEFPLELTLSAWKENNQQFFSGIIRDISQRKIIEAELRESEEKYRSIFNRGGGRHLPNHPARNLPQCESCPESACWAMNRLKNSWKRSMILAVNSTWRQSGVQSFVGSSKAMKSLSILNHRSIVGMALSYGFRKMLESFGMRKVTPQWYEGFVVDISAQKNAEQLLETQTRLQTENMYLQQEVSEARAFGDLIGKSPALANVIRQIDLVAPTKATVLILGESGTGKELVAREIHKRSECQDGPLIRVNCASIPRELYESEFFGHVRGAFTGALKDRIGRFEAADGGTLFLDEVGDIPLDLAE